MAPNLEHTHSGQQAWAESAVTSTTHTTIDHVYIYTPVLLYRPGGVLGQVLPHDAYSHRREEERGHRNTSRGQKEGEGEHVLCPMSCPMSYVSGVSYESAGRQVEGLKQLRMRLRGCEHVRL